MHKILYSELSQSVPNIFVRWLSSARAFNLEGALNLTPGIYATGWQQPSKVCLKLKTAFRAWFEPWTPVPWIFLGAFAIAPRTFDPRRHWTPCLETMLKIGACFELKSYSTTNMAGGAWLGMEGSIMGLGTPYISGKVEVLISTGRYQTSTIVGDSASWW